MERLRKPWLRGMLTLAVLGVFGAGLMVSNVGAVPEKREASKKFVKKRLNKQQTQIINQTVGEDELVRYSVQTDVTGGDTTIATIGNFTFKANCQLDGDNTIIGRVLIETSANNAAYASDDSSDPDFDTSDNATPSVWLGGDSNVPVDPVQPFIWSDTVEGNAAGPTGTTLQGEGTFFANVGGNDCILEGYLLQTDGV